MIRAGIRGRQGGEGVTSAARTTWKGRMKEPSKDTSMESTSGRRGLVSASQSAVGGSCRRVLCQRTRVADQDGGTQEETVATRPREQALGR